jgi:hypothetical protein
MELGAMTEIKSCATCIYSEGNGYIETIFCNKYRKEKIDYVKGKVYYELPFCYDLRESGKQCGPEGNGWEQKPPEKKMSMWEVFRDFTKEMFGF